MLKKSLELKEHTVSTSFDVYHDNSIVEVQKLIPLLRGFSSRVSELLVEFPEHPALLQVTNLLRSYLPCIFSFMFYFFASFFKNSNFLSLFIPNRARSHEYYCILASNIS